MLPQRRMAVLWFLRQWSREGRKRDGIDAANGRCTWKKAEGRRGQCQGGSGGSFCTDRECGRYGRQLCDDR